MTKRSNIESSKIEALIPRQLVADAGGMIEFIKEYYRFMHEEQGPSYVINNILANRDVDTVVDAFISLVEKEIGAGFTTQLTANKANLYKNIVQFYQAKGSVESFKLLFRLLYNTDIDVSFPKEKILVASDGRWIQQNSIFIEVTEGNPFDLFANIVDAVTTDRVIKVEVERIRRVEETAFYEIFITKDNNTLRVVTGATIDQYGVKATVVNSLNKYEIYHPGSGFEIAQFVDVVESSGEGVKIKVTEVNALTGALTDIKFINFGVGYSPEFYAMIIPRAEISGAAADPEYNNGELKALTGDGSDFFKKELTVNGVRLVAAGAVGGQLAVPDEFIKKVARMYELFTDPLAAGINVAIQRQFIKDLSGDAGDSYHAGFPTIQRIARGAGSDYTPNFLTDEGIESWNLTPLFDSHVANDMVWYLNSTGSGYGDGDIDAQEVIEHVFHTLHMHGLPAFDLKMYPEFSADWQTGDLFAAIEEAYDAGVFDPSGYIPATWKTDPDAFPVIAKEYLYLLNFCMFEYSGLWEGGSLAPEWSDSMRTQAGILANNPLGYALFNTYIAPVISKPSLATIQNIFQDGDVGDPTIAGLSGYIVDATDGVDLVISTDPDADKVTYPTRAIIKFSESVLAEYRGEYSTNNGFLSDDIYLQDNFFYQQFSYLIRSSQQFDNYKDIVNKTVHPSGMAMFGEFEINNSFDMSRAFELLRRYFTNREEDAVDTIDLNFWTLYKPREDVAYASTTDWFYDFYKNVSEIVNLPEQEIKDFYKVLGDTALTSDELTYLMVKMKQLVENLAISELVIVSYAKPLTEAINSNDSGVIEILGDIYAEDYFAEDYSEGLTSFT
jgi:hypothetical protein